jgi:hypothetical protein
MLSAVIVGVMLTGFFGVVGRMNRVAVCDMCVMSCLVMIAGFMMVCRGSVVFCGVFVMFSGFTMMVCGFLGHGIYLRSTIQVMR